MSITNKFIAKNRLFVLGAGFSADAGVPLTGELLSLTMKKFAAECPGLFERVNNYAEVCFRREGIVYSDINFSDLCTFLEYVELREYAGGERWSDTGSREKLALKFYVSKTIAQHTPRAESIPDIYVRFAEQLHEYDIVISFNWDCLLEAVLDRLGKEYTYDFQGKGIKLCKLHGSINWRLGEPDKNRPKYSSNIRKWSPTGLADAVMQKDIYHSSCLKYFDGWKEVEPLGEAKPCIVLPGFGKAFDVRTLATLWYKPEFAFGFTHNVYIIGLSLTPDDFFVRSFFLDNLPFLKPHAAERREIVIINSDANTKDNYEFALANPCAKFLNEKFQIKHVDQMAEQLKNP